MKLRLILCALVLVTVFQFGLVATEVSAKDLSITLAPGDTARVPLKFWCLDFGKPFPAAIAGPIEGAPPAAQKALQAAIASGATETEPYQTQLAIWRAADGTFHDVAGAGHVLAEQIYSDSLKLDIPAPLADNLAAAVANGSVQVTFENFTPIADSTRPELQPYHGTADMVLKNTSQQNVTFTVSEYALFTPAAGENEQSLISHQDTTKQATVPTRLPTSGGNGIQDLQFQLLLVGLGLMAFGLGLWLAVPALNRVQKR